MTKGRKRRSARNLRRAPVRCALHLPFTDHREPRFQRAARGMLVTAAMLMRGCEPGRSWYRVSLICRMSCGPGRKVHQSTLPPGAPGPDVCPTARFRRHRVHGSVPHQPPRSSPGECLRPRSRWSMTACRPLTYSSVVPPMTTTEAVVSIGLSARSNPSTVQRRATRVRHPLVSVELQVDLCSPAIADVRCSAQAWGTTPPDAFAFRSR